MDTLVPQRIAIWLVQYPFVVVIAAASLVYIVLGSLIDQWESKRVTSTVPPPKQAVRKPKPQPGTHHDAARAVQPPQATASSTESILPSYKTILFLSLFYLVAGILAMLPLPPTDLASHLGRRHDDLNILVLTAHPDDECMFFSPTILALQEQPGAKIRALSLSNGDAVGLGYLREQELVDSYAALGVDAKDVVCLDVPTLRDGMDEPWSPEEIARILSTRSDVLQANVILTFDNGGITRHPNHTPLGEAARHLVGRLKQSNKLPRDITLLTLETVPVYVKFTGPFYVGHLKLQHLFSRYLLDPATAASLQDPARLTIASDRQGYQRAIEAMIKHKTQLEWFRWLYIATSKYMWSDTLIVEQL